MKRSAVRVAVVFSVAAWTSLLVGCGGPRCEKKTNLIDNTAWSLVPIGEDPFAAGKDGLLERDESGRFPTDYPHDRRVCDDVDVFSEELDGDASLTTDTNTCGWATSQETLAVGTAKDSDVFVRIFYFQQIGSDVAEAHLALTIDDEPFWAKTLPLPQPSTLIAEDFKAPMDVAAGAHAVWHLDNHGANTWNLFEFSTTTLVDCPKG